LFNKATISNYLSYASLASALVFLLTIISVHIVPNDLSFVQHPLSLYALGNNGAIIETGFYAIAISQVLLACIISIHFRLTAGSIFLLLAGLGVLSVAIFPVQPASADLLTRLPHVIGAVMQFLFFPVALLLLTKHMPPSGPRKYTLFTGYFTAVMFVIVLSMFVLKQRMEISFFGLVEKTDIVVITLWIITLSYISSRPIFMQNLFYIKRDL